MAISRRELVWGGAVAVASAGATAYLMRTSTPLAPVTAQQESPGDTAPRAEALPHGPLRLDRNESAYGPSPKVIAALAGETSGPAYQMAGGEASLLRSAIARTYEVAPGQVVLGAGSTDLMRACTGLALGPGKGLLMAEPGFAPIAQYARATGAEVASVPLDRMRRQDLAALARRVTPATALIYLSNPHNPTGTLLDHRALTGFLRTLPPRVMVLIDEAYMEYAESPGGLDPSMIRETAPHPRLVVTRTFSKIHGMAGLRVGYGIAAPPIARQITLCGIEDGIGTTALRAAIAALADPGYARSIADRNRDARQEFLNQANARMLEPVDSQTNFVMLFIDDCLEVAAHFARHNVLVAANFPGLAQSIRVTLGTPAQMMEFWRVLNLKRTLRPF